MKQKLTFEILEAADIAEIEAHAIQRGLYIDGSESKDSLIGRIMEIELTVNNVEEKKVEIKERAVSDVSPSIEKVIDLLDEFKRQGLEYEIDGTCITFKHRGMITCTTINQPLANIALAAQQAAQ